jgi:hypothetical protein
MFRSYDAGWVQRCPLGLRAASQAGFARGEFDRAAAASAEGGKLGLASDRDRSPISGWISRIAH